MTLRVPFAALPLIATTGCYFFYPQEIPTLPGPLIQEGAQITLDRSEETFFRGCTDGELKLDECELRKGEWRKRYVSYKAVASYGGRVLTQGEFYQLTIPGYNDGIRAVRADKGTCNLSLVPSVIALAGGVFAMVVLATGDTITENASTKLKLYGVGAGTALLGFGASYPLGGYACRRAGKRGDRMGGEGLDASAAKGFSSLDASDIEKVEVLAAAFNRTLHHAAPTDGASAPTEATSDAPAEAATGADDVIVTMQKDGRFKGSLRLLAATGLDAKLRGGTFTVFMPTDRAFANSGPDDNPDTLLHNKAQLQKLLEAVIVEGTYTGEQLLAGERLTSIGGRRVALKNRDGALELLGNKVVLPPLPASNGLVYVMDR